ncbi:hypothetical protein [Paraburkholderia terrae]|uniref:Uncharacterized protein n=1 Tax=Paraburkholderia terrae TaxID=311230 RepID=A0A2I8ETG8_9BURK|nr:hypothetical protein [Paraburkholderia terrae]AUT62905.1 hypothetical protein C2L65_25380 [Paraburkholderia terrae]
MNRAIPEHWVERLFERMESIWGARFQDFWRNVPDPEQIKAVWREGLAGMSGEALRRGVAALFHEKSPPTLPRFIELCHIDPMYVQREQPALTHAHCVTPVGEAHLAKIQELLAKHNLPKREPGGGADGIRWAFRIVREANERDVPLNRLAIAQDAIRNWCASHGCSRDDLDEYGEFVRDPNARADDVELPPLVPSPHIIDASEQYTAREPGSDDEEVTT